MLNQLRKRLMPALLLSLFGVGICAPAHAGMPVIDAANLAQAIQQVISWGQQLQGMVSQYQQLVSTYDSLTGPRGMQSLVPISALQRNYLPVNYSQLQGVMNGVSASYGPLAAQVQTTVQSNAVLTPQQVSNLSPQAQAYLTQSRRSAATLAMLSQQTQANASSNFSSLQGLISALGSTQDTKASADLSGRIQSEQVMTQTNQIKTDALYQTVQAQQLQNAQMVRELSVQSLGQMSDLPAIQW
ncbi:MAG TPA: type IV secretion system protein [Steroidobacteraceae bacterium]